MMLIAKNSETMLMTALRMCWEKAPTHRCLHLRFSQLKAFKEEWLPAVGGALKAIDEGGECQVYVCHDQDVFILSRSMTQKRLSQFLTHLAPKLGPVPLQGLAALFEIGVDWHRLRALCEAKMESLRLLQIRSAQAVPQEQPLSVASLSENLDRDLISSLAMRRAMRSRPEILVVEDDAFSRKLVSVVLEGQYNFTMAEDGQGALLSYANKAPDIVFLDINLPDMDGHVVLEQIFKIDPHAFAVMFSGNGDKANILRSLELGAKGFIGKPFTKEKIIQYIAKSPHIQTRDKKEQDHGHSNC